MTNYFDGSVGMKPISVFVFTKKDNLVSFIIRGNSARKYRTKELCIIVAQGARSNSQNPALVVHYAGRFPFCDSPPLVTEIPDKGSPALSTRLPGAHVHVCMPGKNVESFVFHAPVGDGPARETWLWTAGAQDKWNPYIRKREERARGQSCHAGHTSNANGRMWNILGNFISLCRYFFLFVWRLHMLAFVFGRFVDTLLQYYVDLDSIYVWVKRELQ